MPVAAVMRGGKPDGQFRIGDHHRGQHLRVEDDLLQMRGFVEDDRGTADLGAGARGGGHGDGLCHAGDVHARVPVLAVLEVPQRTRLPRHQRDGLADVERAAAAEGDDAIAAVPACRRPRRHRRSCRPGWPGCRRTRRRPGRRLAATRARCRSSAACAGPGSVTSRGLRMPSSLHTAGSSAIRPAPKRTAVG